MELKKYLSHGGGVNSYALQLYLKDQGYKFESVFVDTGCERPETYQFLKRVNQFLKTNNKQPITIINAMEHGFPAQREFNGLMYSFYLSKKTIPSRMYRDCSQKFKIKPKENYFSKPCINFIGIDAGEKNRIKNWKPSKGIKDKFPLIEVGIDRAECKRIIKRHGFPIPPKSACYICFNSTHADWRNLRNDHPKLFIKAKILENSCNRERKRKGLGPIYLSKYGVSLSVEVGENQLKLFKRDEYPVLIEKQGS